MKILAVALMKHIPLRRSSVSSSKAPFSCLIKFEEKRLKLAPTRVSAEQNGSQARPHPVMVHLPRARGIFGEKSKQRTVKCEEREGKKRNCVTIKVQDTLRYFQP